MKILEHTSTHLTLTNSRISFWLFIIFSSPFLVLGCLGIALAIAESIFPNWFILFCLAFGIYGVFFTSLEIIWLDKPQNQVTIEIKKLLRKSKFNYPLSDLDVKIKRTSRVVKKYSGFALKREPIYVVILDIASAQKKIRLSGYRFTKDKAMEVASLISSFQSEPLRSRFEQ